MNFQSVHFFIFCLALALSHHARDVLGQSLLRHSRLYRACMGAFLEQLDARLRVTGSDALGEETAKTYRHLRTRVAEYHVIWYLVEILYLSR